MKFGSKSRRTCLMASAATGAALLLAAPGFAQDNQDEDDIEQIRVQGFRAAIESSIEAKRENTSIVEAISAEDIGKLPDNSIAESLARLPGLAAQRLRGRAQVISVRGLGPDFTTALLNGREQVTAGDNRGVEFDQYPSELLSQVVVYKTPDAQLVAQGLAGTADLRTIRPLAHGERTVSVGARYEWNEFGALSAGADDNGYRFTGTYIDQFENDTIGLVLSFAQQSTPTQSERWDAWGFPTDNGNLVLGGAKPYVESRTLERTAFAGTLEFEPSSTFNSSIDVMYSEFEDAGVLRGIEFPLYWSGASLRPGNQVVENGLITGGIFDNVTGIVRNDFRGRSAELFSAGWNVEWQFAENWTGEFDLSFSTVDRDDVDLELYAGSGFAGSGPTDTITFSQQDGGGFFLRSGENYYGDPNAMVLTDPGGWGQAGFIKRPETQDELTALRLSATRDFTSGPIASLEGGVYYSDREKNKDSIEDFVRFAGANEVALPTDLLEENTRLGFLGIPGMVSFDPQAMLARGLSDGFYSLESLRNGDVTGKAWQVEEQVLTAYLQANVDTTVFGLPTRGNFGLQIVNTEQSSTGQANIGGVELGAINSGDDYTDVLPSANFSFEIAEDTFIRLGAARTLARARMDDLRATVSGGVDTSVCPPPSGPTLYDLSNNRVCIGAGGGNPQLQPYQADSFDISFEHYFADGGGYVSVAAFYKDLSDFIFGNETRVVEYGDVGRQALINAGFDPSYLDANTQLYTGTASAPINSSGGGHIQGVEFALSAPGDAFLPEGWLQGFGFLASLSLTDSEIEPTPGFILEIPGLSEEVSNFTIYYENGGFEARLSQRSRSEFLGEVTGFGANREFRDIQPEDVVDAQIAYSFEDGGRFGGLSVYLQGNNLTNERFGSFLNDDPRQVKDYQEYGATYLIGFNWRR